MLNPEEERPRAKKRKEEDGWCLESRLTDDLILNCVARLSRSELAALSLASKSYRSLVASPDLYKIRSLIGRTETHVYVCLRTPPGPDPPTLGWYILRRSETKSDLIPIPSPPPSPPLPLEGSSVVVLDWGIYVIGGLIKEEERTGDVWLLDCRTHTWRPVPSMGVARAYGAAGVVDGKIYVIGGCDDNNNNNNWGQVFDPKTRKWETLPPKPKRKIDHKNIRNSMVRDHKVYAADGTNRTYYYSPREGKWGTGNRGQQYGNPRDWCMIGNLICCLSRYGTIFWCDSDELDLRHENEEEMMMMNTKEVKGLGSLKRSLFLSRVVHIGDQMLHLWEKSRIMNGHAPNNKSKCARMRDLEVLLPGARLINSGGGNIVLFWDHYIHKDRLLEIWCAEISLERRQGEGGHDEVWGKTEWSSVVMTFPIELWLKHHKVLHSVSVTL